MVKGQLLGIPNWLKNKIDILSGKTETLETKIETNENAITEINRNLEDYLAIKNYARTNKLAESTWNTKSQDILTIPTDCVAIEVRFWFSGTSEPYVGHLNFYRNMPRKKMDTMTFYNGTYDARCTMMVDWLNGTVECLNINFPNANWNVGIQFWK